MRIILGSGSPRRKEILSLLGIDFEVVVSDCDENIAEKDPEILVEKLSLLKANAVSKQILTPAIIIGADTVVWHRGEILTKPKGEDEAFRMLRSLADDKHLVTTGVTLLLQNGLGKTKADTFHVTAEVEVGKMTADEIRAYVATGEPMDKAGAYAIQGKFAPYIKEIHGDYYTIVGFPIFEVRKHLTKMIRQATASRVPAK